MWGIVYDVSDPDLIVLDGFEDGYRREKLLVWASGEESTFVGSFGVHRRERRHRPLAQSGIQAAHSLMGRGGIGRCLNLTVRCSENKSKL